MSREKRLKVQNRKIDTKTIDALYHTIALNNGLTDIEVKKIIESPYDFAYKTISELPIKEVESEEDLNKLKTNFIFKYIGKIYTDWGLVNKIRLLKQKMTK